MISNPDKTFSQEMITFLEEPDCCSIENNKNHFTGSAWIVSRFKDFALMNHHKKINKWIQFNGNADGEEDLLKVANKKASEEAKISSLKVLSRAIFDVDIHPVPFASSKPSRYHYDVIFILEADRKEKIKISPESKEIRWVRLGEMYNLNSEISIRRIIDMTIKLFFEDKLLKD